jgi:hypothetical protein
MYINVRAVVKLFEKNSFVNGDAISSIVLRPIFFTYILHTDGANYQASHMTKPCRTPAEMKRFNFVTLHSI